MNRDTRVTVKHLRVWRPKNIILITRRCFLQILLKGVNNFGRKRLTFRYSEGGGPLRAQDVEADAAVTVDVGVVDFCRERDLRTNERKR